MFDIASHLHKTVEEVMNMSVAELTMWKYYFNEKYQESKQTASK